MEAKSSPMQMQIDFMVKKIELSVEIIKHSKLLIP